MTIQRASYPPPPGWRPKSEDLPCFNAGKAAFLVGKDVRDNPFARPSAEAAAWEQGWSEEHSDLVDSQL